MLLLLCIIIKKYSLRLASPRRHLIRYHGVLPPPTAGPSPYLEDLTSAHPNPADTPMRP